MDAHVLPQLAAPRDDRDPTPAERRIAALLVAVMAVGSLVLWLGIPVGWLLLWSRITDHYLTIYGATLIGSPLTIAVGALALGRVNRIYLRVSHTPAEPRTHTPWLSPMSGGGRQVRTRGVLEICMTVSVVVAMLTFAAWIFLFHGSSCAPTGCGVW